MKTPYAVVVLLFLVLSTGTMVFAKEYKAPVIVSYSHSSNADELVPGDELVTTVSFKPLVDFKKLDVRIIAEGMELIETPDVTSIDNLQKDQSAEVKIRVRLVAAQGRVSINYFAILPYSDAFGALNICCYGKAKVAP
jgi:hypothetical protein